MLNKVALLALVLVTALVLDHALFPYTYHGPETMIVDGSAVQIKTLLSIIMGW